MKQESIEKIRQFKKQMHLQQHEKDQLWEIYLEQYGKYPNGEKSCSRCLSDVLNDLWGVVINIPAPSIEEQFKDSIFKPGNHPKKKILNIDKPDKFEHKTTIKKKN